MRVISGKYKGKNLKGFDILGTRPTMDRIKENMFALIQEHIEESIILDLFAGSGSLGIEALSRGARECFFVDHNNIAIKTINDNLKGIKGGTVIKSDYLDALNRFDIKFDLIFLDPPYKDNIINEIIMLIDKNNLLNKNGLIVCETDYPLEINRKVYKIRKYGQKYIQIYY